MGHQIAESTVRHCETCGADRTGVYCSSCGQKEFTGVNTLRGLLQSALRRALNLEEGLAHTAVGLTARPAAMLRDYLTGRTVRYTHPVVYFIFAVSVFALTYRLIAGPTGAADSDRWLTMFVVPFIAAASRLLLWRTRHNYAEHLLAVLYLSGHAIVTATLLLAGFLFVGDDYIGFYAAAGFALVLCYFVWAYSRVFLDRPWVGAVVGLTSLLIGTAAWAASLLVFLGIVRSVL